jgi:hypothetical protein
MCPEFEASERHVNAWLEVCPLSCPVREPARLKGVPPVLPVPADDRGGAAGSRERD